MNHVDCGIDGIFRVMRHDIPAVGKVHIDINPDPILFLWMNGNVDLLQPGVVFSQGSKLIRYLSLNLVGHLVVHAGDLEFNHGIPHDSRGLSLRFIRGHRCPAVVRVGVRGLPGCLTISL